MVVVIATILCKIYFVIKKLTDTQTRAWIGFIQSQQIILQQIDRKFKERGFPPLSWYDVLLELNKAANNRLRQKDIGKKILLSKYNVSRLLDRMEKQGLVSRESCEEDSRGTFAVLTEKGRKLREAMWPEYYDAIQKYFFSKLNENELKLIININIRLKNIDYKNSSQG